MRWLLIIGLVAAMTATWWLMVPAPNRSEVPATSNQDTAPPTQNAGQTDAPSCDAVFSYRPVWTSAVVHRLPVDRLVAIGPTRSAAVFHTLLIGGRGQQARLVGTVGDKELVREAIALMSDRQPVWVNHPLESLPAELRDQPLVVTVTAGDCAPLLVHTLPAAAQDAFDNPRTGGWMRPASALETVLARPPEPPPAVGRGQRLNIDDLRADGDTPLLAAVRRGDEAEALKLIRAVVLSRDQSRGMTQEQLSYHTLMANPFRRGSDGLTAFDLASRLGQAQVLDALLQSAVTGGPGRRRNRGNWGDSTLRTLAASSKEVVRFDDGDTPWHRAVRKGDLRAVLTLLGLNGWDDASGPPRAVKGRYAFDSQGRQADDLAVEVGDVGIQRMLALSRSKSAPGWAVSRSAFATEVTDDAPVNCRKTAFDDESEIHFFAELRDMAGRTIRHDWSFDDQVRHSQSFTLTSDREVTLSTRSFTAADIGLWRLKVVAGDATSLLDTQLGYQALTDYSRKNRAKMNGPCDLGGSAVLTMATAQAPLTEFADLVARGVIIKPNSDRGRGVFYRAVSGGAISHVRWLLGKGIDINARTSPSNDGPLMVATREGDGAMVQFLLANGADADKGRFRDGMTPLHMTTVSGNRSIARLLLQLGAGVDVVDDGGNTALHRAVGRCLGALTQLLLDNGADPMIRNKSGESAKDKAAACQGRESWGDQPGI